MAVLETIEKIIKATSPPLLHVKVGTQLKPKDIILFSNLYKSLNLHKENILIASIPEEIPAYLLTDQHLYIKNERIPISEINNQLIEGDLFNDITDSEKTILKESLVVIKDLKHNFRKTLDSFIDKYKHVLKEDGKDYRDPELFFDGRFVEMLKHEAAEFNKLCNELNKDPHFIHGINIIFSSTDKVVEGYKAEHILIADIIKAYNLITLDENEKSKFTLAFFFESMQGNNMAKGISINRLNQMTTHASFSQNIEKIKKANFIQTNEKYKDEFLLPSILFRIKHAQFVRSGNCIYRFASIVAKADGTINEEEKSILNQILDKTSNPVVKIPGIEAREVREDDNLDTVMKELDSLIGLKEIKNSVKELANLLIVQKIREKEGLANFEISLHAVFMGPPGTGKTTIARLLGRIYKHLGYLEKGHLIETDRAGLVAGFVGQTAIKVDEIIEESKHGLLFIDEAYSLSPEDNGRDFGSEAVDVLLKRMEDKRGEFVVVVAGYEEPMKNFVDSNPGLRSRFNRYFSFNHFTPNEMIEIFELFCNQSDFKVSSDAKEKLLDTFTMLFERRDEGFGNARVVRNIFERCVQLQANRIVTIQELSKDILQTIEEIDVPEPKTILKQVFFTK